MRIKYDRTAENWVGDYRRTSGHNFTVCHSNYIKPPVWICSLPNDNIDNTQNGTLIGAGLALTQILSSILNVTLTVAAIVARGYVYINKATCLSSWVGWLRHSLLHCREHIYCVESRGSLRLMYAMTESRTSMSIPSTENPWILKAGARRHYLKRLPWPFNICALILLSQDSIH